jgi:hypothetical protein
VTGTNDEVLNNLKWRTASAKRMASLEQLLPWNWKVAAAKLAP